MNLPIAYRIHLEALAPTPSPSRALSRIPRVPLDYYLPRSANVASPLPQRASNLQSQIKQITSIQTKALQGQWMKTKAPMKAI